MICVGCDPFATATAHVGRPEDGNGVFCTCVRAPVLAFSFRAETSEASMFDVYRYTPNAGSIVTHVGLVSVEVDVEATAVGVPLAILIAYALTVLDEAFATYTNLPRGSTVTPTGKRPVLKGPFDIAVKAPLAAGR